MNYRPIRSSLSLGNGNHLLSTQSAIPPADLGSHVLCFCEYEVGKEFVPVPIQLFPSGCCLLRFTYWNDYDYVDVSLYGPSLSNRMKGLFLPGVPVFVIAFQLGGAEALVNCLASSLREFRVEYDLVRREDGKLLIDSVSSARTFNDRVAESIKYLRRVIGETHHTKHRLAQNIEWVRRKDQYGLSDSRPPQPLRAIRKQFRTSIGLKPKELERVCRFQSALHQILSGPRPQLSDVALDNGYFDQSHLNNDFKSLTGSTPGRFLQKKHHFAKLNDPHWDGLSSDIYVPKPTSVIKL